MQTHRRDRQRDRGDRPEAPVPPRLGVLDLAGSPRRFVYAAASVPLAVIYAGLFVGLLLAVATAAQGVGVLLLLAVLAAAQGLGGIERPQARVLLGLPIETGLRQRHQRGPMVQRVRALLTAHSTWRTLSWLGVRLLLGASVLVTVTLGVTAGVSLSQYTPWSPWPFRASWPNVAGMVIHLLMALLVLTAVDLQVRVSAAIAPRLLGPSTAEELVALRRTSQRLADRNRLARDLHDSIGHALTASLLQATAARRTLTAGPDNRAEVEPTFVHDALEHIERSTREALTELDRALAVLRDESSAAKVTGTPDLTHLGRLIATLRACGLPVTAAIDVPVDRIPDDVSRVAYRIVQEATTNVLRHAGNPFTTVHVSGSGAEDLTIIVRNATPSGRSAQPGSGGRGLNGLRERVAAVGGHLTAHPSDDGGYTLTARLPLGAAA